MAIQESELLKEFFEYDFTPLIIKIRDYFEGPINGESEMVRQINKMELMINAPRSALFNALYFIFHSAVNEKDKQFLSIEGIDEIILSIQKKRESIHEEFLKAKKTLLKS